MRHLRTIALLCIPVVLSFAGCGDDGPQRGIENGSSRPRGDTTVSFDYAAPRQAVVRELTQCLADAELRVHRDPVGPSRVAFNPNFPAHTLGVIELPHGGRATVSLTVSHRAAARAAAQANEIAEEDVDPIHLATAIGSAVIGVAIDPPLGRRSDLNGLRWCAEAT